MLWIEKSYTKVALISDPHAHLATLLALIAKIPPDYLIIILGDMIDKGKKAKELVEYVKTHHDAILGNHDHFMTVENHPRFWKRYESLWLLNNGKDTQKSYGDKWKISNMIEYRKVFLEHVQYLKKLPLVMELPDLKIHGKRVVLSHAPIYEAVQHYGSIEKLKEVLQTRPREDFLKDYMGKDDTSEAAVIQSIFWKQNYDITELPDLGIFNVFGHTVQDSGVQIGANGAAIDCGVYNNNRMCALLLPELKILEQTKIDD